MSDFRVIYHEPICPDCGSFDITEDEVETGDGLTETALTCRTCGSCWPVACITDWDAQPADPWAHPGYAPDISRGLPAEIGTAMGTWVRARHAHDADGGL